MRTALDVLREEIPDLDERSMSVRFDDLGIDSFSLIELRAALETAMGRQISDRIWMTLEKPSDIIAACESLSGAAASDGVFRRRRNYTINMPQMAVGGLSESWLFKELGDFHWSMISEGLGTLSSQMTDGNGERLYATFTRIKVETAPLSHYSENDDMVLDGSMTRYGGGIFLSRFTGSAGEKTISAQAMSSFTKRASEGSNRGLVKGQPSIPQNCPIPSVPTKPEFADEYGAIRRSGIEARSPMYGADYEINPYHDINGVGLVYFAAYPAISDTCEIRQPGRGSGWAFRARTVSRDVLYFGNANADDVLHYAVLTSNEQGGMIETDALISNRTDGSPMALVRTRKKLNG